MGQGKNQHYLRTTLGEGLRSKINRTQYLFMKIIYTYHEAQNIPQRVLVKTSKAKAEAELPI